MDNIARETWSSSHYADHDAESSWSENRVGSSSSVTNVNNLGDNLDGGLNAAGW